MREYQKRYLQHLKDEFPSGIIRSIVLKPRQSGFSTVISGINVHAMATRFNENGIMLADKFSRTTDVHNIYTLFVGNLPSAVMPMIKTLNGEEVLFDNPNPKERAKNPGLSSGFKSETAMDKNAGRAGTRMWAHLSECSFYRYPDSVDEGIQNSISLIKGTRIFKESTANGVSGTGESFYSLWTEAEKNNSIYKSFFVSWYEVDDYALHVPHGFIMSKEEVELVKRCPLIKNENLVWRRLKLSEYSKGTESVFSPAERFKADFPSYAEEAFLNTGRPVFEQDKINLNIHHLKNNPPCKIKLKIVSANIAMYPQCFTVYEVPEKNKKYLIGADVAEGLAYGDFSSASVIDENFVQVAVFHGHVPPDIFGKILVEIAKSYNKALIIPELNNMGHTTLQAIKDAGYLNIYQREVKDEIDQSKISLKIGWRTTTSTKQKMINNLVARYRENEVKIRDVDLLREMAGLTRGNDGEVELNSKDRVVGMCLALMGIGQIRESIRVFSPGEVKKVIYETKDTSMDKKRGKL